MNNKLFLLLTMFFLLGTGFGIKAQDEHENHDDHNETMSATHDEHNEEGMHNEGDEHNEGVVRLNNAEMDEFGIVLDTAGPGTIRNEIVVPGEIAVNGDRIAHIVPRFSGVVKKVLKRIGDHVRTGDVLAVVESNAGLTPYDVTALMDGTVIDKQINVGEVPQGDNPAFIIADLDTVWVNLNIYQMHLSDVRVGQMAAITSNHGISYATGKISYVSPVVDEHTRTATARVVLDNSSGKWYPGLLVEGRIATDLYKASVVVPKTALFNLEDTDIIFVLTDEGFIAQPVRIGRTNHVNAEIIEGLQVGQVYASDGGFTIKAEMQKESFGEGHAH